MKLSITIVIPTYNGLDLLKKYLPQVIQHAHGYKIIIVDDASTDNTSTWLRDNHPKIEVVTLEENSGFAAAVNKGFTVAETDYVLLLNNDVALHPDTIKNLSKNFASNSKLFAVGALEQLPKSKQRGKSIGHFKRGLLIHGPAEELNSGSTLWVFAASGLFSKKIWQKLSGLDELYFPAYWEDIDLGYRAWKAGYECLFDASATLTHQAEATMNRELGWKKQVYAFKNQLLFFWKNVTSPQLILLHFLWMPYHLTVTTIKTKGAFLLGFLSALGQLSSVADQPKNYQDKRTDTEVILSL